MIVTRAQYDLAGRGPCVASDGGTHFASVVVGRVPNVPADDTPDTPENMLDAEAAFLDARERLADIPVDVVITNHVMGLYELAAIHLSAQPPRLHEASLAINAVGCLVEGMGPDLGEEYETLVAALSNIRLAFVQIKGATTA